VFRPLAAPKPELLRVPSLRNVATTAPYFHDGSVANLAEAVRKMAASQLDQDLSDPQVQAIVAFLRTLTGNYRGAAVVAPPP
jgi:cytochrome c peroxidase